MDSVKVPTQFEPLFEKAQKYVKKYFSLKKEDPSQGTIDIFGQRYILVRAGSMSIDFFDTIRNLYETKVGSEDASNFARSFLYDLAHTIGKSDAMNFHKKMKLKEPVEKLSAGPVHFSHTGWAFVDILPESKPSPDENYYLIYDHPFSFEADAWNKSGNRSNFPVCAMNAGYSAGWCHQSFGVPLVAAEVSCKAMGDDNCRFIMAHPSQIDRCISEYLKSKPDVRLRPEEYKIPRFFSHTIMQDALRKSEERFSQVVENANEWVWEVDANGLYTYSSPAIEKILGFKPEEIVGKKHFYDLMVGTDKNEIKQKALEIFAKKGSFKNLINRNSHRDGRVIWLSTSGVPILDDDGSLLGYRGVDTNVTDRQRYEENLRRAKENAERANKTKSIFLANMSHEIRTPMNGIIGFADMLAEENLTDEQKKYVKVIQQSGNQLMQIINDILDFSKIEVGKLDMQIVTYSLPQLLASIDSMMRPDATEKSLAFEIQRQDNLPEHFKTDPVRINQCLINLVNNAIKFTDKGYVHLIVSLEQINDIPYLCFEVQDTGIGIPEDKLEMIYEEFFQADCSASKKYGGTGLGLAITKRLTKLMGGFLSVTSTLSKGSTFTIKVPAGLEVGSEKNFEQINTNESQADSGKNKFSGNILVAEDNEHNQILIKILLEKMGLNVSIVADGLQAVAAAADMDYDLIFMDMHMPEMNGYEATKTLREKNIPTPIIALTANAMKGDREKCLEAGCNDYIAKPIKQEKLLEIIKTYLSACSAV